MSEAIGDVGLHVRLSLFADDLCESGGWDGAWWPRSRRTVEELTGLFKAMERVGSYSRATLDGVLWLGAPRPFRIMDLGRVVRWGWFVAGQDPHRIELFSLIDRSRSLFVVPPEVPPQAAAYLMDPGRARSDPRGSIELLSDARERAARAVGPHSRSASTG